MRSVRTAGAELLHEGGAWANLIVSGRRPMLNFGDEVSPLVLRELTGLKFRWAPMKSAEIVGVGSLLQSYVRADADAVIFGTGSRTQDLGAPIRGSVVALRGPMTAAVTRVENVALGDPGLAVRALSGPSRPLAAPVVLPHFRAFGSAAGRKEIDRLKRAGYRVVMPNWEPLRVAEHISRAEFVLTSSLHGLIFAQGLDRRVRLMSFRGVPAEPTFKYDDHLAVFGLKAEFLDSREVGDGLALPKTVMDVMDRERSEVASRLPAVLESLYKVGAALR